MASFVFRRAQPPDFPAIFGCNPKTSLPIFLRRSGKKGFFRRSFRASRSPSFWQNLGTAIAAADAKVVGFLCAFRNEFNHGSPVIAKMLDTYDLVTFDGKPLNYYNSYIYGPVCIDRVYRRRGLLRGLYEAQKQELAGAVQRRCGVCLTQQSPFSECSHRPGWG